MTLWAEGFRKLHPGVRVQIEGKGSSTAPPAPIAGTAQLGPMSRAMKSSELDEFERRFGYKPTQVSAAVDALAVYVNKDNPIEKLTLPQIDAIFSKTGLGGYPTDMKTWGDLGLSGDWAARPISVYGRNSASGTYAYFKEHALFKGDYRDTVKEQPGSASVVQGVTEDLYGIAAGAVSGGGLAIIASILGIFAFILVEVWPLLRGAGISPVRETAIPGPAMHGIIGDEHRTHVVGLGMDGVARAVRLPDGEVIAEKTILPAPADPDPRSFAALLAAPAALSFDAGPKLPRARCGRRDQALPLDLQSRPVGWPSARVRCDKPCSSPRRRMLPTSPGPIASSGLL